MRKGIAVIDGKFNAAAGAAAIDCGIATAAEKADAAQHALVVANAGGSFKAQHSAYRIETAGDSGNGGDAELIARHGVANADLGTHQLAVIEIAEAERWLQGNRRAGFAVAGAAAGRQAGEIVEAMDRDADLLLGAISGAGREACLLYTSDAADE